MRTIRLVILLMLASAAPARAEPPHAPSTLSELYDQGAVAFEEGRYGDAAAAFERAYRVKPAQSLLFNIARAYDRKFVVDNDDDALKRAIAFYREYVAQQAPRYNEAIGRLEALTLIQARRTPEGGPINPYPNTPPPTRPAPQPAPYVASPPPDLPPATPAAANPAPATTAAPPSSKPAPVTASKPTKSKIKWMSARQFLGDDK